MSPDPKTTAEPAGTASRNRSPTRNRSGSRFLVGSQRLPNPVNTIKPTMDPPNAAAAPRRPVNHHATSPAVPRTSNTSAVRPSVDGWRKYSTRYHAELAVMNSPEPVRMLRNRQSETSQGRFATTASPPAPQIAACHLQPCRRATVARNARRPPIARIGVVTWTKNNRAPMTVKATHPAIVALKSNRTQSPRSRPTLADARTNANSPLRQSVTGNPTQKLNQASPVATATSAVVCPAAQAPPAIATRSRIDEANSPTLYAR